MFARANLILFPRIPDEEILGEPLTPTTIHVRSLLDLTNYPSYFLYVLDRPSLSQYLVNILPHHHCVVIYRI
ncbi:hypothetical protein AHAS_Ahas18G0222900 [Arachis hypogaea]